MKIKVATTFSFRSDSKDGQCDERYISSALTVEPDICENSEKSMINYHEITQNKTMNICKNEESITSITIPEKINLAECKSLKAPRFMVVGKPCTGKTTLAKQLCTQFGCELVNATELIEHHLRQETSYGVKIKDIMASGSDLEDSLVLQLLKEKLQSPECLHNGYVIDGIPTHSEHCMTIEDQLEYIFAIENGPTYLIDIQISNEVLRKRWSGMRIDYADGKIYSNLNYEDLTASSTSSLAVKVNHPDFPMVNETVKDRLLVRHEELPEILDRHFLFYDSKVSDQVNEFISKHDSSTIISVDGLVSPSDRFQETMAKLQRICKEQGYSSLQSSSHKLNKTFEAIMDEILLNFPALSDRKFWTKHPLRIVMLGKPCTGKTTLAKYLCTIWSCEYINSSELILDQIGKETSIGKKISEVLKSGSDLPDSLVMQLLEDQLKLNSEHEMGYILDGLPSYSEKEFSVVKQIQFLEELDPPPNYWIFFEIDDKDLFSRWEGVRIDHMTGFLYSKPIYDATSEPNGRCDFPSIDEDVKNRLLMRFEELSENLRKHFHFYNGHVEKPLRDFVSKRPTSTVIRLNANQCLSEVGKELIEKILERLNTSNSLSESATITSLKPPVDSSINDGPSVQDANESTGPYTQVLEAPDKHSVCCCRCGIKMKEIDAALWQQKPPRFLIIGKPCTGKTTLAKRICNEWNCILVNGTELVIEHLTANDNYGKLIKEIMTSGRDLSDDLVIDMLSNKLRSPDCLQRGFVIDDFPTFSEKKLPVNIQLDFLQSLLPKIEYVIQLQLTNDDLRNRWGSIKMDFQTGLLYVYEQYVSMLGLDSECCVKRCNIGKRQFPVCCDDSLLVRHEDLRENLEKNINFYQNVVEPRLKLWLEANYADCTIVLNADQSPNNVFQDLRRNKLITMRNSSKGYFRDLCCRRCSVKIQDLSVEYKLWSGDFPRFLIFGKPCTGKTTLAKRLCAQWGCELINASDLVQKHVVLNTMIGRQIKQILNNGADLGDDFVLSIIRDAISSSSCENGYIIDCIPTYSEKSYSIEKQLEFLNSLNPPINYIVDIRVPDAVLRKRWESVRIDISDGSLYSNKMYSSNLAANHGRHPDFPRIDEQTKDRLLTRHEEMPENLDKHFQFYHANVAHKLQDYINKHDKSKIIILDGELAPTKMFYRLLYTLRKMAMNLNVQFKEPFPYLLDKSSSISSVMEDQCSCRLNVKSELFTELWMDKAPRIIILGKPCTGKRSLARRLCSIWNCHFVNVTEMLLYHLNAETGTGKFIRHLFSEGRDLPDMFALNMIADHIASSCCVESGYILTGIPTHSEHDIPIQKQMEILMALPNAPEYIIEIEMDDAALRSRWKNVRMDVNDGKLYSNLSFKEANPLYGPLNNEKFKSSLPDFPSGEHVTREGLITRHEELPESLDKHFDFYTNHMNQIIKHFIETHDPAHIVRVNGELSLNEMFQTVIHRFLVMSKHPGVEPSVLFADHISNEDEKSICQCICNQPRSQFNCLDKDHAPRILIVGKSCTGKTTLAKQLSDLWKCVLINATELINTHLGAKTELGEKILRVMLEGHDLSDEIVINILKEKLESSESVSAGYVIDDLPTSSEKFLSVAEQLDMLSSLSVKPEFIVDIDISDSELRQRWESVRIDMNDGTLHSVCKTIKSSDYHPAFPDISEDFKRHFITRHEEIYENICRQTDFYNTFVQPKIREYIKKYEPSSVIRVDGKEAPEDIIKVVTGKICETYNLIAVR